MTLLNSRECPLHCAHFIVPTSVCPALSLHYRSHFIPSCPYLAPLSCTPVSSLSCTPVSSHYTPAYLCFVLWLPQSLPRGISRFLCSEDWPLSTWQGLETEKSRHLVLHHTGRQKFQRGRINSYVDHYPAEVRASYRASYRAVCSD
jgi:hypothetical protein